MGTIYYRPYKQTKKNALRRILDTRISDKTFYISITTIGAGVGIAVHAVYTFFIG